MKIKNQKHRKEKKPEVKKNQKDKKKKTTDNGLFEVEKILDDRVNSHKENEYFVKWKGYPPEENTWEPEYGLRRCNYLLNQYLNSKKKKDLKEEKNEKNRKIQQQEIPQKTPKSYLIKTVCKKTKKSKINYDNYDHSLAMRLFKVKKRIYKKNKLYRGANFFKSKTYMISI